MARAPAVADRMAGDDARSWRAPRWTASRSNPHPRRYTRRSSGTPHASAVARVTSRLAAAMSTSMKAVIRLVYGVATIRLSGAGRASSPAVRAVLNQASGVAAATRVSRAISPASRSRSAAAAPRAAHRACSRRAKVSQAGSTPWATSVGRYHWSRSTGRAGGSGWG